jgi:hypothetical protein
MLNRFDDFNIKDPVHPISQNGMDRNCTRLWLLEVAKTTLGQDLLDVGITNNLKKGLKVKEVKIIYVSFQLWGEQQPFVTITAGKLH